MNNNDALAAARVVTDVFGKVFADAFARFTVEILRLLKTDNAELLRALETAASTEKESAGAGRNTKSQVDGDESDDLASTPEWIKQAYERAKTYAAPCDTDPAVRRALLVRDRLMLALKRRNMTQTALAKQLGKTPSQISRIFANPQRSRLSTLAGIADALDVDLSDLLRDPGGDEPRF